MRATLALAVCSLVLSRCSGGSDDDPGFDAPPTARSSPPAPSADSSASPSTKPTEPVFTRYTDEQLTESLPSTTAELHGLMRVQGCASMDDT